MTNNHTVSTGRIDPDDALAAQRLPCRLAPNMTEVLAPWTDQLPAQEVAVLADLATTIRVCSHRIAMLATRSLPTTDDALIGALTLRVWSLGVADTADRLASELCSRARSADETGTEAGRAQLRERYASDPARIRRDGLDLLAGALLPS